jgi:drug/metabolite transporter (DMT)-like permease
MLALGLRLLAIAFLALMLTAIKLAGERGVNLVETLFYRQFLSLPIVLGWLWLGPGLASVRTQRLGAHGIRTAAGLGGMALNFLSVLLLPLAEATTISFTVPIFATILSALLLKEHTGIHRWSAVIIGFLGVLVMVGPNSGHFPLLGAGVAIAAALGVAVITILLRQIGKTEAAPTTVFWFTLLSIPPLGLLMLFSAQNHDLATWGLLLLLGLAGGAAQLCLTGALRWAPVSVVMPMDYTSLIWATFFGWLIWDHWPGSATWAGAVLIVASGLYIAWRERSSAGRKG